jgi:prepilin-type N-terminal cleavage/methylation domain-containing protein
MRKGERGISLIEVLIALAVLGIIAVTFLTALAVSGNSVAMTDEDATAESIARSQLEYIRQQVYIWAQPGEDRLYPLIDLDEEYSSYSIWSVNRNGEVVQGIGEDAGVVAVPWNSEENEPRTGDIGLQRIRLVIKNHGEEVLVLETYKVDRGR